MMIIVVILLNECYNFSILLQYIYFHNCGATKQKQPLWCTLNFDELSTHKKPVMPLLPCSSMYFQKNAYSPPPKEWMAVKMMSYNILKIKRRVRKRKHGVWLIIQQSAPKWLLLLGGTTIAVLLVGLSDRKTAFKAELFGCMWAKSVKNNPKIIQK